MWIIEHFIFIRFVVFLDRGPNRGRYGDFGDDREQRGGGFNNRNPRGDNERFGNRDNDRYGNYGRRGNEPRTYNNQPDSKPAAPMHGKDIDISGCYSNG